MIIKKYGAYKNSNIEWIGEIPKHWEIKRIKDIFSLERGKFTHRPRNDEKMYNDGKSPFIQTGDVAKSSKYVVTYKQVLNENGIKVSREFKKGTLLMTIAANIGDVAILGFDAYFPDSLVAFKTKYSTDYYYYLLLITKSELDTVKVTNTQDNLNLERLNGLRKLCPPIEEQIEIAIFLDKKTQEIDNKISQFEKKIGYYQELRQSLINSAVLKGLDKSANLIESDIEWVGQLPKNWRVKRVKDYFNLFTGNSISDKTGYESSINAVPYVATKDINFETGSINYENGMYIPDEDKSFKRTKSHTTLICIEGANAGKKIGFTDKEVAFVNKLCAVKSNSREALDKYYYYYTQSSLFSSQFFSLINGLIGGVSVSVIRNFAILIPTRNEQIEIIKFLEVKLGKLNQIIANIQLQICKLEELRNALINDIVTGKIKIINNK